MLGNSKNDSMEKKIPKTFFFSNFFQKNQKKMTSARIVFISGHCNLSSKEFQDHYIPRLDELLLHPVPIVVGNAYGADTKSFEYLTENNYPANLIIVYHHGTGKQKYPKDIQIVSNFTSYTKRDAAMTFASTEELLWVRPDEESKILLGEKFDPKRKSGTELNRLRRIKMNSK
jgi:hypothetical protein